jgi:hypothetical protein
MRPILRGSIITLVGAGLLVVVYATRPDVPVGSATSRAQQPAGPARSAATATTRPNLTGLAPNAVVADAVKPISSDLHTATIRPEDAKGRATMPTRRSAPINLQVPVSYGEKAVKISVRRQLNAPPVHQASLTGSARRPGPIMTAGWSSQAP